MNDMSSKHYLILGASSDLGLALCELLKKNSAELTVHGNQNSNLLSDHKSLVKHDFLNDDIDDFINIVKQSKFDGIVSFLGKAHFDFAKSMSSESLESCLKLNYLSNALIINSLINNLKENASIIFCSSIVAHLGEIGMSHYSASKSALTGLMRSLLKELSFKKVRVNLISPYLIETRATAKIPKNKIGEYIKKNPLKRMGNARDVANLALFLLSNSSQYINGQDISVSGGHEFIT